ncbi:MAG: hypothetical protein ACI9SC_002286 [Gammaproteobacteria bacterium]|jgi:hypothetical protein
MMFKKILLIVLCLFSFSTYAEELTDEKKKVIDELLEITGALRIGEVMGAAVANQMITALTKQKGELDPKIVEILKAETAKIMHDEYVANGWINNMSHGIYHKYLSMAEIQELVDFYKTPTGSKVVSVLPLLTQEGMLAGQAHGQTLGPIIQQGIQDRFRREGIK